MALVLVLGPQIPLPSPLYLFGIWVKKGEDIPASFIHSVTHPFIDAFCLFFPCSVFKKKKVYFKTISDSRKAPGILIYHSETPSNFNRLSSDTL
jgi:hypothetical protein